MQAPAPPRLIEGGLPTEATVAQVLVSKYADHLPLYRQAQIYARQGIELDRSTLADWVGQAAFHRRPLHERLLGKLRQRPKLFADETTMPVLDPGRGRTKTGQLWAYAADDRPWAAPIRRASPMSMPPTARPTDQSRIWQASRGSCRSMATPAMASWLSVATSSLHSAGHTCGVTSTNLPPLALRPLRARRSSISPSSITSRRTSVAAAPRNAVSFGNRKADRWRKPSNGGSVQSSR